MSTYDEALLKDSPEVTNQARQEGYNVDLLQEKPAPTRPLTPPTNGPVHTRRSVHPPGRTRLAEEDVPPIPMNHIEERRVPFWRTTKGLALIAVGAIVIIGAIVGGAVGGTVANKNKKHAALPNIGSSGGSGDGGSINAQPNSSSASASTTSSTSQNAIHGASSPAEPKPTSSDNGNGAGAGGGGGSNSLNQEVRREQPKTTHSISTHSTPAHQATHAAETTSSKPTSSEPAKPTHTAVEVADSIGRVIDGEHL